MAPANRMTGYLAQGKTTKEVSRIVDTGGRYLKYAVLKPGKNQKEP